MRTTDTLRATALAAALFPSLVAAGATAAEPAPKPSQELPQRKPGLWHFRTIAESFGTREIDSCIADGDALLPTPAGATCAPLKIRRGKQEIIITQECKISADETQTTSILFTGDFQSWYRGQSKITVTKPNMPRPIETVGFTLDAKYLSETCPTEEKK